MYPVYIVGIRIVYICRCMYEEQEGRNKDQRTQHQEKQLGKVTQEKIQRAGKTWKRESKRDGE